MVSDKNDTIKYLNWVNCFISCTCTWVHVNDVNEKSQGVPQSKYVANPRYQEEVKNLSQHTSFFNFFIEGHV